MSKAEAETIIRWDDELDTATVYTASERMAKKCAKWGWPLAVKSTFKDSPTGWEGQVPKRAVKLTKRTTMERRQQQGGNPDAFRKAIPTSKAPRSAVDRERLGPVKASTSLGKNRRQSS